MATPRRENAILSSFICREKHERSSYFSRFLLLLIIFFSVCLLARSLALFVWWRSVHMAVHAIIHADVCAFAGPYDHIARSFGVGYLFYNDDRSINQIEWSAFVRASPIHNIEPYAHYSHAYSLVVSVAPAHQAASVRAYISCIVYHWAQLNGFTLRFGRI